MCKARSGARRVGRLSIVQSVHHKHGTNLSPFADQNLFQSLIVFALDQKYLFPFLPLLLSKSAQRFALAAVGCATRLRWQVTIGEKLRLLARGDSRPLHALLEGLPRTPTVTKRLYQFEIFLLRAIEIC